MAKAWASITGLMLLLAAGAAAQGSVTIPGTERYLMKSTTNGVEYQVDIALPAGYEATDKRYPTFYILDANMSFGMLVDTYRDLRIDGTLPELILVGVGYPGSDPAVYTPAYAASRSRDYTPTNVEASIPGSGEGRAFLTFLQTELLPLIDGRYRTDSADRGLGGHSLGGLFTTYALLTEPAVFRRYWIGSPSLWWNNGVMFERVAAAKARAEQPRGRAFLTVGALETDVMVPPMQRMALRLKSTFPTLEVGSIVYPEETHISVVGGAISRALRFLYARKRIPISLADAASYAGQWRSESGDTVTVATRGARVSLTMKTSGEPITIQLAAESRDHLFGTNFTLELAAERDSSGRVVRLRRTFLGAETVFERSRRP
jgi:predicted alpha/beta superfamily hydrolase